MKPDTPDKDNRLQNPDSDASDEAIEKELDAIDADPLPREEARKIAERAIAAAGVEKSK